MNFQEHSTKRKAEHALKHGGLEEYEGSGRALPDVSMQCILEIGHGATGHGGAAQALTHA